MTATAGCGQARQAPFSAPPTLGVLINRLRRGYSAPAGGDFKLGARAGRLAARNRSRECRDAGERVRWPDPSRATSLDAVATRCVEQPGLADQ
jgi:hypothetical protein